MPATGPTTQAGKAASSRNALKHGILSAAPLVTPQEDPGEWLSHLAEVRENLAPRDHLETCLAERVALLLWRMRRLACAEALAIAWRHDRIVNDYPQELINGEHPSPVSELVQRQREAKRMLALWTSLGEIPDDQRLDGATAALLVDQALLVAGMPQGQVPPSLPLHGDWAQELWTGRGLRACLQWIVGRRALNEDYFRSRCLEHFQNEVKIAKKIVEAVDRDLQWMACRRMLPSETEMQLQVRYEAHLGRELSRTMKTLRELQSRPASGGSETGVPAPPPVQGVGNQHSPVSNGASGQRTAAGSIPLRSDKAADPLNGSSTENCQTNSAPMEQPTDTPLHQRFSPAQQGVKPSTAAATEDEAENCETNSTPAAEFVGSPEVPRGPALAEGSLTTSTAPAAHHELKNCETNSTAAVRRDAAPAFDDPDAQAEFDLLSKKDPAFLKELQERAFIACVPLEAILGERRRQAKSREASPSRAAE